MRKIMLLCGLAISSTAAADTKVVTPPPVKNLPKPTTLKPIVVGKLQFAAVDKTELTTIDKGVRVAKGEVTTSVTGDPCISCKQTTYTITRATEPGAILFTLPAGTVALAFQGKSGVFDLKPTPSFAYAVTISENGKVSKQADDQKPNTGADAHPWMTIKFGQEGKLKLVVDWKDSSISIQAPGGSPLGDRGDVGWTWKITPKGAKPIAAASKLGFKSETAFTLTGAVN